MKRALSAVFAASFLLAHATPSLLLAQDEPADRGLTYRVTAISFATNDHRELVREAMDTFEQALEGRGFRKAEHPYWTFAVAVRPLVDEEDLVALSVVATAALPERVVDWAKDAQIFYAGANVDDLPAEGRFIREYVSEDYIRQYGMLQEHDVIVVNRADLPGGASSIVDRFVSNHFER